MRHRATALQLSPAEHVRLLHPGTGGGVPLVVVSHRTQWGETCIKRDDAEGVAELYLDVDDVYIGQQAMRGRRSVRGLHGLGVLFLDLDTRNVAELNGVAPEDVCSLVLERAAALGIPEPTLVMFTGRGLAVNWAHGLLPPAALPRWQAVEDHLIGAFKDLGADGAVRDAARVLRLVGSRHSGTGETVRPLHIGERVDFETMALGMLPLTRRELAEARAAAAKRKAIRRARRESGTSKPSKPTHRLNRTSWAETLMSDLLRLHEHRYGGGIVPKGSRDMWHLALSVVTVWLEGMPSAQARVGELGALVGRTPEMAIRRKGTVLRRAEAAARGTTVEIRGRQRDPRYTPRSATVMTWLGITEGEARDAGLRMLITPDLKRERERARWHTRRAAKGGRARAEWLDDAEQRAKGAAALRVSGLTWSEVAQRMSLPSKDAARKLAQRAFFTKSGAPRAGTNAVRSGDAGGGDAVDASLLGAYGNARTKGAPKPSNIGDTALAETEAPRSAVVIPFPTPVRTSEPRVMAPLPQPSVPADRLPENIPPPPSVPDHRLMSAMARVMSVAERVASDRAVPVARLRAANRMARDALVELRQSMDEMAWDRLEAGVETWSTSVWDISRGLRRSLPVMRKSW